MSATSGSAATAGASPANDGSHLWYKEFYAALDGKDGTLTDRLCAEDVTFRMGNMPAVHGREALRESIAQFYGMIGGMRHQFTHIIQQGDQWCLEEAVEYTRLDGNVVSVPAATVVELRHGLVADMRVYVDVAPVFA